MKSLNKHSVEWLEEFSLKVEGLVQRYDIEKTVYDDLHKEYEDLSELILKNPQMYKNEQEHNRAITLSRFIVLCLLLRINEFSEAC